MLGVKLFVHAFTMLFHDIRATVRIILFPLLIGTVLIAGLLFLFFDFELFDLMAGTLNPLSATTGLILPGVISFMIYMFVVFWSAVGWHRYVLLNERPDAYLPRLNGPLMAAYFWAAIRVFLVVMALLFPTLFLLMGLTAILGFGPAVFLLVTGAFSILGSAISFRFALILPAAAIGKPISLGASWKATEGYFWALVVVAVASNILGSLTGATGGDGLVALALIFILSWLNIAVGISILTTLYGRCIERRELD